MLFVESLVTNSKKTEKTEGGKVKKRNVLFCLAVALAMAVTIPAIAFAGTTLDDNGINTGQMLATLGAGGGPTADIVAGLTSDDAQAMPAMMSAIEDPPDTMIPAMSATAEESPAWTQAMITAIDSGGSGGSTHHVGKILASVSTMMNGDTTSIAMSYTTGLTHQSMIA